MFTARPTHGPLALPARIHGTCLDAGLLDAGLRGALLRACRRDLPALRRAPRGGAGLGAGARGRAASAAQHVVPAPPRGRRAGCRGVGVGVDIARAPARRDAGKGADGLVVPDPGRRAGGLLRLKTRAAPGRCAHVWLRAPRGLHVLPRRRVLRRDGCGGVHAAVVKDHLCPLRVDPDHGLRCLLCDRLPGLPPRVPVPRRARRRTTSHSPRRASRCT